MSSQNSSRIEIIENIEFQNTLLRCGVMSAPIEDDLANIFDDTLNEENIDAGNEAVIKITFENTLLMNGIFTESTEENIEKDTTSDFGNERKSVYTDSGLNSSTLSDGGSIYDFHDDQKVKVRIPLMIATKDLAILSTENIEIEEFYFDRKPNQEEQNYFEDDFLDLELSGLLRGEGPRGRSNVLTSTPVEGERAGTLQSLEDLLVEMGDAESRLAKVLREGGRLARARRRVARGARRLSRGLEQGWGALLGAVL